MYRPEHKAIPGRPFLTILRYNRPYLKSYLIGGILSVFFVVIGLGLPFIVRGVVRSFTEGQVTMRLLWLYFAALIAIAVTTGFARYWERMLIIRASRKCEYDLRNDYFRHIQTLSQDFFHRTQTGDLMARATNDLNYVRMFIGPGIMGTIDMIQLPLTLAILAWFSSRLLLYTLIPLPFVSIIVYFIIMYMHRQSQRVQAQYADLTAQVQENLAGARVVQAYGIGERETESFTAESESYMRENVKLAAVMSLAWPLIGLIVGLMIVLVLWLGGFMVINGVLALDDFTGFVVAMLLLLWPLVEFGWILTLYQRGIVGMARMNDIFREKPSVRDDEDTQQAFTVTRGGIRFDTVSFSYDSRAVLQDLDFTILPGQTVAIVGPTGSGKTTVVSLIMREYDVNAGTVFIDDLDVRRIPLRALRQAVGYVPQDTFLFSESIRENITFGKPDATDEQIRYACEVAQLTETIDALPGGIDTLLGERGVNLSGGQKQRLAIARAVIADPKILILDDAMSSVDTQTEEKILERLRLVMEQRTSIIISHRISTVRNADLILVVDDGRIVERGSHESLLALRGLYADLHERQLLEEELEHL
ncbi:MAG: ABC transporter ATP-binding protein [Candidatus Hydrogenedentes bacterium]|nr:ABC transporter ATP-binding protein [Candidatus Hydrogenedentota bacterium]